MTLAADNFPSLVPVDSVRPSPENASIYGDFDYRQDDDAALIDSIRERGILEPLIVDADGVILSGHRRHAAALEAGLGHVPVRRSALRLASLGEAERLRVLAAFNATQRRKDVEEITREVLMLTPSDDPLQWIRERIEKRAMALDEDPVGCMEIEGTMRRCAISAAKQPFLAAVRQVLQDLKPFWPASVRLVHYRLLNAPPLIHARKQGSRYRNNHASYRALVELAARARLAGLLPWDAIADETRPVKLWQIHSSAAAFVEHEARYMLACYRRDLMQGQPRHVEIICEKNTAAELVRRVANDYTIPVTSGRGYCSLDPRRQMVRRYEASGKQRMTLVIVSDADPDGDEIAGSLARSLRDDFVVHNVEAVRAALTPEQARAEGLPANMDAKTTSSNFAKFVERHGCRTVYELEALPPARLQQLVRQAVESVLDVDRYKQEVEAWRTEAIGLKRVRERAVAAALRERTGTCPSSTADTGPKAG